MFFPRLIGSDCNRVLETAAVEKGPTTRRQARFYRDFTKPRVNAGLDILTPQYD